MTSLEVEQTSIIEYQNAIKEIQHLLRLAKIEKKVRSLVTLGLSSEDAEIIREAEKERYGPLEGCGCLQCASFAIKNANSVLEKIVGDKWPLDSLKYYLNDSKHPAKPLVLNYQDYLNLRVKVEKPNIVYDEDEEDYYQNYEDSDN